MLTGMGLFVLFNEKINILKNFVSFSNRITIGRYI